MVLLGGDAREDVAVDLHASPRGLGRGAVVPRGVGVVLPARREEPEILRSRGHDPHRRQHEQQHDGIAEPRAWQAHVARVVSPGRGGSGHGRARAPVLQLFPQAFRLGQKDACRGGGAYAPVRGLAANGPRHSAPKGPSGSWTRPPPDAGLSAANPKFHFAMENSPTTHITCIPADNPLVRDDAEQRGRHLHAAAAS